eukprot:765157-Hanusia_phi.AAC.2
MEAWLLMRFFTSSNTAMVIALQTNVKNFPIHSKPHHPGATQMTLATSPLVKMPIPSSFTYLD